MNCPHCKIPLLMTDRKGIEIDYCSQCRGVWLDRGELDKIIELSINERSFAGGQRANAHTQHVQAQRESYADPRQQRASSHHAHYEQSSYKKHKPYGRYKKKKSLLGEVFDIFD